VRQGLADVPALTCVALYMAGGCFNLQAQLLPYTFIMHRCYDLPI
jgi:hypothetical protein